MPEFELFDGDCLDVLPGLDSKLVDCVVTDPPFAFAGGISNGMTSRADSQFFVHWLTDVCKHLIRVTKDCGCMFFWCDWKTVGPISTALTAASEPYRPWGVSQLIVHDREMLGMGRPFRNQCDFIAFARNKKTQIERIPKTTSNVVRQYFYYGKHPHHPAEKSLDVARHVVQWACDEGGVVLDPFCGSGTIPMAAVLERRTAIGIETDRGHANVARLRFSRHLPCAEVTSPLLKKIQPG